MGELGEDEIGRLGYRYTVTDAAQAAQAVETTQENP